MSGFLKICSFLCTQYLVGPPFAWITASMRRDMEAISLWHCWGEMEAQVALKAAFRSYALLGLVSLIFLLTVHYRFCTGFQVRRVCWPFKHRTSWSLNQLLVPLAVWEGAKSCWKMKSASPYSLKEAWSSLKFLSRWLRWLWTSKMTVDQHQQMTWLWKLHTGLEATWILFLFTLSPDSGT